MFSRAILGNGINYNSTFVPSTSLLNTTSFKNNNFFTNYSIINRNYAKVKEEVIDKDKFVVTFTTPGRILTKNIECKFVYAPGQIGYFTAQHRQQSAIRELAPGRVSIYKSDNEKEDYFVSGGFAFSGPYSVTIAAFEAVPVNQIDVGLAKKGLDRARNEARSAGTDLQKVQAEIGVQVYSGMLWAATGAKE